MYNQIVFAEIFWEVVARDDVYRKPFAYLFTQQIGDFHPPDIFGCRGMGAGFGYQYSRCFGKRFDCFGTIGKTFYIAFISCKKHRKRSQTTLGGSIFKNRLKSLRVCDNQLWHILKYRQRFLHFFGRTTYDNTFFIEQFAYCLYLWQYEPAFRCLCVLRHYEHHQIALCYKVARNAVGAVIFGYFFQYRLPDNLYTFGR